MKRELVCIICPKGCRMIAQIDARQVDVRGNSCPRGREYAITECLNPVRTVTTTVRVANRCNMMVSVKTKDPVPKDKMFDVVMQLRKVAAIAPIAVGDVIASDICGSKIIATTRVR